MLRFVVVTLMAASLNGCVRAVGPQEGPTAIPAVTGAYPDGERLRGATLRSVSTDEQWIPADGFTARLAVVAAPLGFYRALPGPGERVPVRTSSWPGAVRLGSVVEEGVVLQGDPVDARNLAGELRCGDRDDAGQPVRLGAMVMEDGDGLAIEAQYEGRDPDLCFVSAGGRRRLTAVALDLYLWARATSRAGSELRAGAR